jgi:hypothetical protein
MLCFTVIGKPDFASAAGQWGDAGTATDRLACRGDCVVRVQGDDRPGSIGNVGRPQ